MLDRDLDYPTALLVVVLVAVVIALVAATWTAGAALSPFNYAWDGGSDLHATVDGTGAESQSLLTTAGYGGGNPADATAFVLGPTEDYSPGAVADVRSFVRGGGRLVVAADDNATNDFLTDLGVTARLDGTPLRDEQHNVEDPALPVATNVSDHPLTANVSELSLNHGTVVVPDEATLLANSSDLAYLDENDNGTLDGDEELRSRSVATVGPLGSGEVVVVSDASVFANAMLEREGNRQFLENLVGDRDRALVDYSHAPPLPPLSYAYIVVRQSPALQAGLGVVLVGGVLLWGRIRGLTVDGWRRLRGDEGEGAAEPTVRLAESEVRALIEREHPSWRPERVDRVTKAIIRQRAEGRGDD